MEHLRLDLRTAALVRFSACVASGRASVDICVEDALGNGLSVPDLYDALVVGRDIGLDTDTIAATQDSIRRHQQLRAR